MLGLRVTLRGAPADLPFKPDARTLKAGLNFTFDTLAGSLDILGELSGVGGYPAINRNAVDAMVFGVRVRVISLEDLIRAKKAAGRVKDRLHLLELEELKRMKGQKQ